MENFKKILINPYSVLITLVVVIRIIYTFLIGLDSDEVMWAVMADEILTKGRHFLYFTNQNFRGSVDAYVVLPFQFLFGVNYVTLRMPGIIFGALSSAFMFFTVLKITKSKISAILAGFIYTVALFSTAAVMTKSWGSYILIQFVMMCTFYAYTRYKVTYKLHALLLLGLVLGLSFWANEQSIYFTFIILIFSFADDFLKALPLIFDKNKPKSKFYVFGLWLPVIFLVIISFYFIAKKRMIFNPVLTLIAKLNITSLTPYIDSFNITLFNIILFTSFVLGVTLGIHKYILKKQNISNLWYSSFGLIGTFSLLGYLINIHNDSFSRISAQGVGFAESFVFLRDNILFSFFSYFTIPVLFVGLIGTLFRLRTINFKSYKIELIDLFLASFVLFPLLFLFSGLPGLTPTPRYLIIWYPIACIVFAYGVFQISKFMFSKFKLNMFVLPILAIVSWLSVWLLNLNQLKASYASVKQTEQAYLTKIEQINLSESKECVGDYWDVGLTMFYSKLYTKCYTQKIYGTHYIFLDMYKPKNK